MHVPQNHGFVRSKTSEQHNARFTLYFEYQRTTSDIGSPTQNMWIAKPVATALSDYAGFEGNTMKFINR